jgi:hypothetical protein
MHVQFSAIVKYVYNNIMLNLGENKFYLKRDYLFFDKNVPLSRQNTNGMPFIPFLESSPVLSILLHYICKRKKM